MTPAVVAGADINGLGVVRSLARKKVPVWLIGDDAADPAMRTRYSTRTVVAPLTGSEGIDALIRLRASFDSDPVLFLTREETVEAVSRERERVQACYRISMPCASLMDRLMDKAAFQQLAEERGFPIPRAVRFGRAEDLASADAPGYPCVLKPVVKTASYVAKFSKAYKVQDRWQLEALLGEIGGAAEMIAQEWIEGGDDRIHFCLQYRSRHSGEVVSFSGRKLRSWPPATGGTASCVPAPDNAAELARLTDRFFTEVGYFGIGSMEFKQDQRTGRFLMIEPTVGRTDFQEEIAVLNGVNIPYAAYCGELDRSSCKAVEAAAPAAWSVAPIDRWSSERQSVARDFPRGLRRYDALRRLADPMPWCVYAARRVRARVLGLGAG